MAGNKVVICKGLSENNTQEIYIKSLESAGYICQYLKTLEFEFINILELQKCLSLPNKYTGLILTSSRAIEAISIAMKDNTNILDDWAKMPTYCVGPATDSLARTRLHLQCCIGREFGTSRELAEKIIRDVREDSKPLLYPCSDIARETIARLLNDNGVSLQRIKIYKTLQSKSLAQDLSEILKQSPNIFVFFSPSTVENFTMQLKKTSYNIKDIKAVAIGPVTRDALINFDFNVYATADKPEPGALTNAIVTADKCNNWIG